MGLNTFKTGDVVKISFKVQEGSKSKSTPFEGVVIAIRGNGLNKTFTVRKVTASKVAVEKIFPLASPLIEKVKIIKENKVRRAKLYYLRKK